MTAMAKDQPSGRREPVQIPSDMKAFNRALIQEFRATGGQLSGPMAGRSLLLLTTTGVRSGRPQTVVVGYGRQGDRFVVIASNNGAASHPVWYRNLVAKPTATVEVGPAKFEARARTARPDEREQLTEFVPYLPRQQALTTREIPIVVLDRVSG